MSLIELKFQLVLEDTWSWTSYYPDENFLKVVEMQGEQEQSKQLIFVVSRPPDAAEPSIGSLMSSLEAECQLK